MTVGSCWRIVGATLTLLMPLLATQAGAGVEGDPPFRFYAFWRDVPRLGEMGRVLVHFGGAYGDSMIGRATVHLPAGVELVQGDTLVDGFPARELEWTLQLRVVAPGEQTICGVMSVDRQFFGVDEAEFDLQYFTGDSASKKRLSRPARAELVRRGQRFRYGSTYLVPIDSSERVTQEDLDRVGSPRVLQQAPAADSLGVLGARDSVGCIVFVKKDGTVRDIRIIDKHERIPGLRGLIQRALIRDWRFEPVRWEGRPMDSWVFVRVPIGPA